MLLLLTWCLPHHLLSGGGWLGTSCMSEQRRVWVNAGDLELLIQAASQLSAAAVSLATAVSSQREEIAVGSFSKIAAETEPEGLDNHRRVWETQFRRPVEEGPPDTPDQLYEFGRCLLPVSAYTAHVWVRDAFVAGFWARVSLDCQVPYRRFEPAPRAPAHWVVLRAGDKLAPVRFEDFTSFDQYTKSVWGEDLVSEVFQNVAEVHIFCHAARSVVPQCLVWRSNL